MELGNHYFPPPPSPHESDRSPGHPPQSRRGFPPLPMVRHFDTCSPACLRGQSPGLRLCRRHHRWRHPLHQPVSVRSTPPSPRPRIQILCEKKGRGKKQSIVHFQKLSSFSSSVSNGSIFSVHFQGVGGEHRQTSTKRNLPDISLHFFWRPSDPIRITPQLTAGSALG